MFYCKQIKSDICIHLEKSKDNILVVAVKLSISPRIKMIQVQLWSTVEIIIPISTYGKVKA